MSAQRMPPISRVTVADLCVAFRTPGQDIEVKEVLKDFKCDLEFSSGHILLTGPNGVGKSVFGKTLGGYIEPSSGSIAFDDQAPVALTPLTSKRLKIEYVPQFLPRASQITAAEMLWSNSLGPHVPIYSRSLLRKGLLKAADAIQLPIELVNLTSLFSPLSGLSPLERATYFLVDAIVATNRLLVLDEPTASLSFAEATALHRVIDEIASHVITAPRFIMISHPTQAWPARFRAYKFNSFGLSSGPPGSVLSLTPPEQRIQPRKSMRLGLVYETSGAQKTQIMLAGDICVITGPSTAEFRAQPPLLYEQMSALEESLDIRFVPENASKIAIVDHMSLTDNLVIDLWERPEWTVGRGPFKLINRQELIRRYVTPIIADMGIAPSSPSYSAGYLSGGNRQKLILARSMFGQPDIVILVDAFKGLDNDNVQRVARFIETKAADGAAFILFAYETGPEHQVANMSIRLDQVTA